MQRLFARRRAQQHSASVFLDAPPTAEFSRPFSCSDPPVRHTARAEVVFTRRLLELSSGKQRSQFLKFYADEFSSAEYVGYIDSDAALTTWVPQLPGAAPSALFAGVRPRIPAEAERAQSGVS